MTLDERKAWLAVYQQTRAAHRRISQERQSLGTMSMITQLRSELAFLFEAIMIDIEQTNAIIDPRLRTRERALIFALLLSATGEIIA